jgi:hypothetical protein
MESYYIPIKISKGVLSKYLLLDTLSFAFYTDEIIILLNRLSKNTKRMVKHENELI